MTPVCSKCGSGNIVDDIDRESRMSYKKCMMCGGVNIINEEEKTDMARSQQITPTDGVRERLVALRAEKGLKWVEYLELCGLSRSQWDCIANLKPMGQAIYERVAQKLNVPYEWLMEGELGDGVTFVQGIPHIIKGSTGAPVHDAGYPLPVEELPDGQPVTEDKSKRSERGQKHKRCIVEGCEKQQAKGKYCTRHFKELREPLDAEKLAETLKTTIAEKLGDDIVNPFINQKPPESRAVKTLECYEFAKDGHMAKIWLGGAGSFKYATVNAVQKEWTFDDWMFLGEVSQEIKRLVQG